VIGFTFDGSHIIASTLWLIMNLKQEACTSICLNFKSPRNMIPPLIFLPPFRCGKKFLVTFYSQTNIASTPCQELNLQDNSTHKDVIASMHKVSLFQSWQTSR
jgi:hypothetical protein